MPLKSILARIAVRKAIGVYVSDKEVVVSKVVATTLGPVEVAQLRESYTPDQLGNVLTRVLTPLLGRWKRFPLNVAVGLSGQRVFYSTRPIKSTNSDASPEMLLHEVLQSASISVDDMALDVVKTKPDKRLVASIVSCRRKYLSGLLSAFGTAGVNPFRAEPAPCALLRVAALRNRMPRKAKTVVRMFLNADQGLAVLSVGNVPFVWRYFSLPAANEATAILAVTRTLQTLSKPCGHENPIDVIVVHGRPDLRELVESEPLQDGLGIPTSWVEGPALDESTVAFGLGLGCLTEGTESLDLARSLRPRRSLWELFPWGEVALQTAMIICMGLFLANRSGHLDKAYSVVSKSIGEHVWLHSLNEQDLEKERKDLQQRVDAVRKFLATRIVWTSYARDIPTRMPKQTTINGIEGMCDLEISGKKKDGGIKQKKSFVLRLSAPMTKEGKMPKEIDDFMNSLREHPLLKKDFPTVELREVVRFQPFVNSPPTATFTVICLPAAAKATPKPEAEAAH